MESWDLLWRVEPRVVRYAFVLNFVKAVFVLLHFKFMSLIYLGQVIVSGKLRAQRAKSMKFKDGYMISSGQPVKEYIDSAVRHVLLRQVSSYFFLTQLYLLLSCILNLCIYLLRECLVSRLKSCLIGILKESRARWLLFLISSLFTHQRKKTLAGQFCYQLKLRSKHRRHLDMIHYRFSFFPVFWNTCWQMNNAVVQFCFVEPIFLVVFVFCLFFVNLLRLISVDSSSLVSILLMYGT